MFNSVLSKLCLFSLDQICLFSSCVCVCVCVVHKLFRATLASADDTSSILCRVQICLICPIICCRSISFTFPHPCFPFALPRRWVLVRLNHNGFPSVYVHFYSVTVFVLSSPSSPSTMLSWCIRLCSSHLKFI